MSWKCRVFIVNCLLAGSCENYWTIISRWRSGHVEKERVKRVWGDRSWRWCRDVNMITWPPQQSYYVTSCLRLLRPAAPPLIWIMRRFCFFFCVERKLWVNSAANSPEVMSENGFTNQLGRRHTRSEWPSSYTWFGVKRRLEPISRLQVHFFMFRSKWSKVSTVPLWLGPERATSWQAVSLHESVSTHV